MMAYERRGDQSRARNVLGPLNRVVADYGTKPHTPELVNAFQTVLWTTIGGITGVEVVVPAVAESLDVIAKQERAGKGLIFVPVEYARQAQRPLIAAAFRVLVDNEYVPGHWSMQEDNPVKNDLVHSGFRWVDMAIDAPHTGTNERQARDEAEKESSEGINLSEYLLAGLYSKITIDRYLDQVRTWSRLLGSSRGGQVIFVGFYPDGFLRVNSNLDPQDRDDVFGARFSQGVKSA